LPRKRGKAHGLGEPAITISAITILTITILEYDRILDCCVASLQAANEDMSSVSAKQERRFHPISLRETPGFSPARDSDARRAA
jgi:hypothetical protein